MELPVFQSPGVVLPGLYAGWMGELLRAPIPAETEATCEDCAMCADSRARQPEGFYFDPQVKCCSYVPELPNFLAGQILTDRNLDPPGRATLESRLASGVSISPLGVGRHPTFQALYQHMTAAAGFGRSQTIRCPHLLHDAQGRGICGIWRHRNSVCATFYCKHVRGATGKHFWNLLQNLLTVTERRLAQWCVLELDIGEEALARLFGGGGGSADPIKEGYLDGVPDPAVAAARWGRWAGRERDFYAECARLAGSLSWAQVVATCGPEVRAAEQLTRIAFDRLVSPALPPRLRAGSYSVVASGADTVQVQTYSGCDPVEAPKIVLNVLHYFDGSPAEQVLRRIEMERGIRLEESLIRKLFDFRILVASS